MSQTLDVYLHRAQVGTLTQTKGGQMSFKYREEWLADELASPLSLSLPLQPEPFKQPICRPYFAGILPEERARELIARKFGISANNDFALLEKIGGECAGAVTLLPAGERLPDENYSYQELSEQELVELLERLPQRPLLAGERGVRLSLAGAQFKAAIKVEQGKFSVPLYGAPSTHILKISHPDYDGLIENEAFCLKMARGLQLQAVEAEIREAGGIEFLLIKRFDRTSSPDGSGDIQHRRIHQEDFCQAMGILSQSKYQKEGGPSLKNCFELLDENSSIPLIDRERLMNGVLFNYLIGNNDAHGKNFSLIHEHGKIRFAPLYDLICTLVYRDLSTEMAMRIGKQYDSKGVTVKDFEMFATDVGMSATLMKEYLSIFAQNFIGLMDELSAVGKLEEKILTLAKRRCQSMIAQLG